MYNYVDRLNFLMYCNHYNLFVKNDGTQERGPNYEFKGKKFPYFKRFYSTGN